MTSAARPGAVLKALRLQKGWTQSDVAKMTGFRESTLSKIENDKVSMSYDKLARLSKGLGVDIGVFFSEEGPAAPATTPSTGRRSIIRKGEGRVIETDTYRYRFVATDLLNKRFVPIFGESYIRSIDKFGEMIRHPGEEFAYIIEGALELHTELYAPVRLEVGDAIYFDSGLAHAYIEVGSTPCRALIICSGDESQLMSAHQKASDLSDLKTEKPVSARRAKTARRRRAPAR
ncbi:MAG: helix-turn-helix domain-containing protein [Rhizomicrobium sp.]